MKPCSVVLILFGLSAAFLLLPREKWHDRQDQDQAALVNLFIGTDDSRQHTVWESNGGTYPGAALPFGMVQVTPEGYKYGDPHLRGFSFLDHFSGYPEGSCGHFLVTPYSPHVDSMAANVRFTFSHRNESASPGYYSVLLEPDSIAAEVSVTGHAGYGRFTFPAGSSAGLQFADLGVVRSSEAQRLTGRRGPYYYVACFNLPGRCRRVDNRILYEFNSGGPATVDVKIGFSTTGEAAAQKHLDQEIPGWDFGRVVTIARDTWNRHLQSIRMYGGSREQKIIFYTALYHAFLDPHLWSDSGDSMFYSELSPWDTFHCKQPLVTLLQPERAQDMIRSLLRTTRKTGKFPVEDMEGIHNIAILVDGYMKGLTDFDAETAYQAMRACLLEPPYGRPDIAAYLGNGYCPDDISYSVSKTLEYAYDFWALAQMAQALNKRDDYLQLLHYAGFYRNVFDAQTRFMIARTKEGTWSRGGYREGTAWTYTWCVPHDVQGLIHLFGGARPFCEKLDSCFAQGFYVHDNEPPLHYPYLFNPAGQPWKTQWWVHSILEKYYANDPGGLNGNDDLGALSAWYVFSAMGLYPLCPGSPYYELTSPLFEKIIVKVGQNKTLTIRGRGAAEGKKFIRSILWNGEPLRRTFLTHSEIMQGGELDVTLAQDPDTSWAAASTVKAPAMTHGLPDFRFRRPALSRSSVKADEAIAVSCDISNTGSAVGAALWRVRVGGRDMAQKQAIVQPGLTRRDTLVLKLYTPGHQQIHVAACEPLSVYVQPVPGHIRCLDFFLPSPPIAKVNEEITISALVKNVGSESTQSSMPLRVDGKVVASQVVRLAPGEQRTVTFGYLADGSGRKQVQVADLAAKTLQVHDAKAKQTDDSFNRLYNPVVVYTFDEGPGTTIPDHSGNGNHGRVIGHVRWQDGLIGRCIKTDASQGSYVEIPDSRPLAAMAAGPSMSVLAWVYPMDEKNFSDIVTQGDWNVLQIRASNTELNYYSGSWRRGEVYTLVQETWNRHWHHMAGVTDGLQHKLYIDGVLCSSKSIVTRNHPPACAAIGSYHAPWNLGRNAEVPNRVFNGYLDEVRIYRSALSQSQIQRVMMLSDR